MSAHFVFLMDESGCYWGTCVKTVGTWVMQGEIINSNIDKLDTLQQTGAKSPTKLCMHCATMAMNSG